MPPPTAARHQASPSATDNAAFYDCMAFVRDRRLRDVRPGRRGLPHHPHRGRRPRGGHGQRRHAARRDGEFGFAASGTCLQSDSAGNLHLATGGVDPGARLPGPRRGAALERRGHPVAGGASAGIYSVSFRGQRGVAVGGDYAVPDAADRNAGWTADGGRTGTHLPAGAWAGTGRARPGSTATGAVARCSRSPDRLGRQPRRRPVVVGVRHRQLRQRGVRRGAGPCYASGEKGRVAVLPPLTHTLPAPDLWPETHRRGPDPGRGGGISNKWEGVSARRGTLPAAPRAPRGAGGSGRGSGRAGGRSSA